MAFQNHGASGISVAYGHADLVRDSSEAKTVWFTCTRTLQCTNLHCRGTRACDVIDVRQHASCRSHAQLALPVLLRLPDM